MVRRINKDNHRQDDVEIKPEAAVEKPSKPKESLELKPRGRSKRQWMLMLAGVGILVLGVVLAFLWMDNQRNSLLAMATIVAWVGGGYLVYNQLQTDNSGMVVIPGEAHGESKNKAVNSLNIYARKDEITGEVYPEKISFEWVDNPRGQPQQCLNTGKYYYVHWWDISNNQLRPFMLPDAKYTDPAFMARYLELPAQKKYLKHRESLMKYIGPGILGLLVAGGFIAIIALSG